MCEAGYFCPQGSTGLTNPCSAGYFCPAGTGAGTRFACPLGTYSSQLGLVNASQCIDCPVGHYCPDGTSGQASVAPLPCPPGSYNPYTKAGHVLNCRPCSAGFSCPRAGQNASTDPCMEGYYCPNGTITNTQFACPPGSYTNSTNLTRPEECTPCPPGFSCGWATGFPTSPWQPCQQGHFCPLSKFKPVYFIFIDNQLQNLFRFALSQGLCRLYSQSLLVHFRATIVDLNTFRHLNVCRIIETEFSFISNCRRFRLNLLLSSMFRVS